MRAYQATARRLAGKGRREKRNEIFPVDLTHAATDEKKKK
jgi:hypothetical protein